MKLTVGSPTCKLSSKMEHRTLVDKTASRSIWKWDDLIGFGQTIGGGQTRCSR